VHGRFRRAAVGPPFAHDADHVFHDHDGSVHDEPKVDRAQAHQVSREAGGSHCNEGAQHRQRDHRGHQQSASNVSEQQEKHQHDQDTAFDEIRRHGADGSVDQVGTVVEGFYGHPFRQCWPADDRLAFSVTGRGALTHHRGGRHRTQLVDGDRRPFVAVGNHDSANVIQVGDQSFASNEKLLSRLLDVCAAGVGVVAFDCLEHVAQRNVEGGQSCGVELDFVRLQLPAERIDLDHARDRPELVGDVPVEGRPQLHRRVAVLRVGSVDRAHRLAFHGELVDLTQPG